MRRPPRHFARSFVTLIGCCSSLAFETPAQTYPAKPIRILVGQGPGGGADSTARIVAPRLSDNLGQPVVVENRTGAGGSIAIERAAAAPPDGYTLLLMNAGGTIHSALRTNLSYDLQRDLAPIALIADSISC